MKLSLALISWCIVAASSRTSATATTTVALRGGGDQEHAPEERVLQDQDGDGGEGYYDEEYYEYEPWDNGTPVYYVFEDGPYEGTITGYDADTGTYETTWSDGDVESYDDTDLVDQMVADYNDQIRDNGDGLCGDDAWPDGTDVWVFEEGQGWWGKVTHCQDGVYTTTWENGDVGYYDEGPDFDQMVEDAQDTTNSGNPQDKFQSEDAMHDFTEQKYDEGTVVYKQFEDGWYQGVILSFQDGVYSVQWSDGEVDQYDEGDEMDQMVADAAQIPSEAGSADFTVQAPKNDDGGRSGGAIFAILLLVVCASVIAIYAFRRNRAKKFAATNSTPSEFQDSDPNSEPQVMVQERELS